jgi:hypothetical protein
VEAVLTAALTAGPINGHYDRVHVIDHRLITYSGRLHMPTIDPAELAPADLVFMLRAWAGGLLPSEAAVGLLIAHGYWLRRADFLTRLVDAVDDGWGPCGAVTPMAAIDWAGVTAFSTQVAASSSELAVLRIATSLAVTPVPQPLMDLTTSLDDTNGRHVLDALAHRFGWHEYGTVHTVTGHQAEPVWPLTEAEERVRHG